MKINLSRIIKSVFSIMLILLGIALLGNTNNNPISFIGRIFKPIIIGSGTFYYSGILPIILNKNKSENNFESGVMNLNFY